MNKQAHASSFYFLLGLCIIGFIISMVMSITTIIITPIWLSILVIVITAIFLLLMLYIFIGTLLNNHKKKNARLLYVHKRKAKEHNH